MNDPLQNPQLVLRLQLLSQSIAVCVMGIGGMVLLGWIFDIDTFTRVLPGLATMKLNTALAFILAGLGLYSLQRQSSLSQATAIIITLIGLLTLSEYGLGWNLGIDQWLVKDVRTAPNAFPGRMSEITAANFVLLGVTMWLIAHRKYYTLANSVILVATFFSLVALLGYVYNPESLYQVVPFSTVALHTAIAFIILCIGLFTAQPNQGLAYFLTAHSTGGYMLRRLLPAALVMPIVTGWLIWQGEQHLWHEEPFTLALFTTLTITAGIIFIWWITPHLHRLDSDRNRVLEELQQANEQLEQRVQERTQELVTLNTTLQESEERYRALFNQIEDAIFIHDQEANILDVNQTACERLGYSRDELLQMKTTDLDIPDYARRFGDRLAQQLQGGKLLDIEGAHRTRHNELIPIWVNTRKITYKGQVAILAVARDISERKQAEAKARELEKEQAQVKLLATFIRDVSHDFRTPLTSIKNNLYLITKTTDPHKQSQYLSKAEGQITQLTALLERLLIMTQLDSQTTLPLQPLDVNAIVAVLCNELRAKVAEKPIILYTSLWANSLKALIDHEYLYLALKEIGQNAVAYTPAQGAITIQTQHEGHQAIIEIRDTGIGIPSRALPHIFDRLYRVEQSRSSKTGGSGLGLAIAKRIIELHQGSITAESRLAEGSVFRVYLPLIE